MGPAWSFADSWNDEVGLCRAHARDIGAAFQNREDLRPPICTALERLCTQNRAALQVPSVPDFGSFTSRSCIEKVLSNSLCVLQALGATEGIGYADPARDDDDDDGSDEAAEQATSIPDTYTLNFAQQ